MPGFDGTGPDFAGPMICGARGICTADTQMARIGYGRGQGLGRYRGLRHDRGRGTWSEMGFSRRGNRLSSDPVAGNEATLRQLKQQATSMQQRLNALNAIIESLKANAAE